MNFNNIVIVGGGSAGWMTAATLVKAFPNKNITLVESPEVPAVGVGESTTQLMRRWLDYLGIPNEDLIKKCNATNKLSIRFENFNIDDKKGFHYPFGRLDERRASVADWFEFQSLNPTVEFENFVEMMSPIAYCLDTNKVPTEEIDFWNLDQDAAWHFDTHLFYGYLRDEYAIPRGVKRVVGHVENVEQDENGFITSVITKDDKITGDVFFDCTGFKRLLIEGTMKEPWRPFNNKTYTDSAWAAGRPYVNKEEELRLYTNSVALRHGWVWEIPNWARIGTGYNYASEYISDEDALQEFKDYLGPIHEQMEFKHIRMRNGMSERMWVKNCVSIGLSGAFIEPLESNGLMSVHEFLINFVNICEGKDILNNFDAHSFNHVCKEQFLYFADFITIHYAMTNRSDSKYWQDIMQQEFNDSDVLKQLYDLRGSQHYEIHKQLSFAELGAHLYMLAGHKINPFTNLKESCASFWGNSAPNVIKNLDKKMQPYLEQRKQIIKGFPSSVEYYEQFHR